MGNISFLATQSLSAIEDWMKTAQGNVIGSTQVGFKENQVMYNGGQTQILSPPDLIKAGIQIAEQSLATTYTSLNWNIGDLVSSTEPTHLAIQGDGLFMVLDKSGNVFYTRNGEFFQNAEGKFVNSQGLMLVDRALAINLGLYTPTTPTVAEINTNTAGWQKHTGNWFPYVAGTNYEEAGSYQNMTIVSKYTFPLDKSKIVGNETIDMRSDNAGYVVVNGHVITASDVLSGPYPGEWNADTRMNIGPYLKDGLNTIMIQSSEFGGGETSRLFNATFTDLNANDVGTTNGKWATEIHPSGFVGATPPDGDLIAKANSVNLSNKDIVIAKTSKMDQLEYSKYGAVIFQRASSLPQSDFTVDLPEKNGLGKVLPNKLESSNVNLASNLTDMAALGKMYNAFVQLVSVYNTALDEVINLIQWVITFRFSYC